MKQKMYDLILEKCQMRYRKGQDGEKGEEKVDEKCKAYKECQCEEEELQEAFFANNYK